MKMENWTMISWLNWSNIRFALTENPPLYRNHLQAFWESVVYIDDENGPKIEASIQGHHIEIT